MKALALLVVLLSSLPAGAQLYRVGGRSAAMGGSFVGLASDPSALWYNPAGIGTMTGQTLSGSANAYSLGRRSKESFIRTTSPSDVSGEKIALAGDPTLASFAPTLAYSFSFGDPKSISHAAAVGVFVPEASESLIAFKLNSEVGDLNLTISERARSQDINPGLGYALTLHDLGFGSLALGFGVFLGVNRFESERTQFQTLKVDLQPPTFPESESSRATAAWNHIGFFPVVGALLRAGGFSVGLRVQPPALSVWGKSDFGVLQQTANFSGIVSTETTFVDTDIELRTPLIAAVGAAYEVAEVFAVSVQAVYRGKVKRYDLFPNLPASVDINNNRFEYEATLDEIDEYTRGALPARRRSLDAAVDFAAGVEYHVAQGLNLRAGGYTLKDTRPDVKVDGKTVDGALDLLGVTFGVGVGGAKGGASIGTVFGVDVRFGSQPIPGTQYQFDDLRRFVQTATAKSKETYYEAVFFISGVLNVADEKEVPVCEL